MPRCSPRVHRDTVVSRRAARIVVPPVRQQRMLAGLAALRDAARALRGNGAGRQGAGTEMERGALFDLASLADHIASFAEDQGADDWSEFWVTVHDVQVLRTHTAALAAVPRGLAETTLPALAQLADDLMPIAESMA